VTYALGKGAVSRDPAAYDRAIASLDASGQNLIWYSRQRFDYDMLAEVLADPMTFLARVRTNLARLESEFGQGTIFHPLLWIPVALGVLRTPWDRRRTGLELYQIALMVPPFAFLALHIEVRFFAPVMVWLLIWLGSGLVAWGEWLRSSVWEWTSPPARPLIPPKLGGARGAGEGSTSPPSLTGKGAGGLGWLVFLPALLVILYFVALIPGAVRSGQASLNWGHKQAGEWLRTQTPAGAIIMSRDLAVAIYANREWVASPNADWPALLAYARHHRATHLVVDEREVTVIRPQLAALADPGQTPVEVTLLHTIADARERTLIYQFR